MPKSVATFLMFTGQAEEAMSAYVKLFAGSAVGEVQRWQAGEPGEAGKIKAAHFTLAGHAMRCFDSMPVHAFTFTPSTSLFVECASEAELRAAHAQLAAKELMPLGSYGFSQLFAWVNDRFGVSWQLSWG